MEVPARNGRGRSTTLVVSLVLGVAALWLLTIAARMQVAWMQEQADTSTIDTLGWIAWLCMYAASAFLATLAFRLPTRLRYRPVRALLGAAVPVLLLAQLLMYYAGWMLPLWMRGPYSWETGEAIAVLAALVGVSLACGFEAGASPVTVERRTDTHRDSAEEGDEPLMPSARP